MDLATALYNQLKAAEPFFLLAGLNLIESEEHIMWMAKSIKTIASKVGLPLVFQSSFDKLIEHPPNHFEILEKVKIACDIPIVTDVHESIQCEEVGKVADIIQIPSFLCCQTDLLVATTKTGKIINIKKGQFCAPSVMLNSVEKVRLAGNPNVMVCEREQCLDTTDVVDPKSRHKGKLETKSLLESRDPLVMMFTILSGVGSGGCSSRGASSWTSMFLPLWPLKWMELLAKLRGKIGNTKFGPNKTPNKYHFNEP
ncbi:hypothetical protein UlMin_004391 [Ulmus minor]